MATEIQAWPLLRGGDGAADRVTAAAGDTAITTTFTPVTLSSSKTVVAGDGETVYGVQMQTSVSGDLVTVIRDNAVFQVQAASGVNFANGAVAYLAASYEVDAGASGNLACGIVTDFDPATAGIVHIELITRSQTTHA